jgi:hypothetical protein
VEDTSAGVLILHEGKPFPGGDLSVEQRLRAMEQAVNLTLTLLSKESIGPKRVTGILNRFYQNICNAITGDVSFFQDAGQNERSHDGELSPAGESIRSEVENESATY